MKWKIVKPKIGSKCIYKKFCFLPNFFEDEEKVHIYWLQNIWYEVYYEHDSEYLPRITRTGKVWESDPNNV